MFQGETPGKWEPFKVREKETNAVPPQNGQNGDAKAEVKVEPEYYEDQETEEDAVWPIKEGRIVDWPCFFALFEYIYNRLSPGIHTPICLVGQPCWTVKDHHKITQFIFEKFRPPAFNIVDAALCSMFAHKEVQNACIIDVGYEKADVTAIVDFNIHTAGRQIAMPNCGGEAFTKRLQELLASKKWNREMAEQLKKSPVCELLPPGIPLPGNGEITKEEITNPAAAASTGATASGPGHRLNAGALGEAPMGPGPDTQIGEEPAAAESEGVLDIAKIVGSGNTKDFIAQKEKEKQDKQQQKKGKVDAATMAQQAKNAKMANRDKAKASFIYSDYAFLDALKGRNLSADDMARAHAAIDEGAKQTSAEKQAQQEATDKQMDTGAGTLTGSSLIHNKAPRREIEVGIERFQAATGGAIESIADAVQRAIGSVGEVAKRSELWDNLIVVGNGAKIRGMSFLSLPQLPYNELTDPQASEKHSYQPSNRAT